MKNIIFLSYLNLWSMDTNKGAPSFYKTIEGYIKDDWNVILINPRYSVGVTPKVEGLTNVTYKPIFLSLTKIRKIGLIGRILHTLHGSMMLYKLGKKEIKKLNNEAIIYAYEVHAVKAGKKLSLHFGLPFITRFQGTILAPIKNTWINRLKFYPHFQALSTTADLTIMTDDGTKGNMVLAQLDNQSTSVYFWRNGVDIKIDRSIDTESVNQLRKKYNISPENKVLLTVSRLASWKKVNRAIEAMTEVIQNNPKCKLIIVGDGDEKDNLISLRDKLDLEDYVIFAGAIPQNEVIHYMDMADIFLSLYDLSNVGNPLLEAMSCGKPIITLNVGDTASLITHEYNGILLNINELDKIPFYINKILDNNEFALLLGKHAKEYAHENFWTWHERIQAELNAVRNFEKD